ELDHRLLDGIAGEMLHLVDGSFGGVSEERFGAAERTVKRRGRFRDLAVGRVLRWGFVASHSACRSPVARGSFGPLEGSAAGRARPAAGSGRRRVTGAAPLRLMRRACSGAAPGSRSAGGENELSPYAGWLDDPGRRGNLPPLDAAPAAQQRLARRQAAAA